MRRTLKLATALLVSCLCAGVFPALTRPAAAQPVAEQDLPAELRDWQAWAMDGSEFLRCPYVSGLDAQQPAARVCHWIASLEVEAREQGASFREVVRVYAPAWVALPGDLERWPQNVRADGSAIAVIDRNGRPSVRLDRAGEFTLAGELPWGRMPDALPVPSQAGIVTLTVAGQRVRDAELAGGALRLGASAPRVTQANALELRIHRKLRDEIPGFLITRLTLQVAGEAREEFLGPLLPAGFVPMHIQTALPARLEGDGRLRVQVRPGTWTLELLARAPGALEKIAVPAVKSAAGTVEEVWSFEGTDRLRVASVEGVPAVDPAQSNVPPEWQALPAFRAVAGATVNVIERSRGFGGQDLNRLSVQRDLWRDFDRKGFTFRDRVSGQMRQAWRLDMLAPFDLQGARTGEQPLLVTKAGAKGGAGIEWRSPQVGLEAVGRIEQSSGEIPASGWDARLAQLSVTLHLPPGQRLLAAFGADDAPTAWLNRWRLLDIFIVLLVVAAAFRVAGVAAAVLAAAALLLAHHEQRAVTWLMLNLLIAIAVARAIPEGRFRAWAHGWRNVAFAIVLVALVPFTLYQARLAFFPQLQQESMISWEGSVPAREAAPAAGQMPPPDMQYEEAAVAADAVQSAPEAAVAQEKAIAVQAPQPTKAAREQRAPAELRYAPGTVLQSGPGVPEWSYGRHPLGWDGPVDPQQTLRPVVIGPLVVSLWRLAACVLLAVLFVALARESYGRPSLPLLDRWLPRAAPGAVAVALLLAALGAVAPAPAQAQMPSAEVLEQLRQRLSRPPECAPSCISVSTATLRVVDESTLEVSLEAHAQTRAVLVLPSAARQWHIESARIDGAAATAFGRDESGRPIIALEAGVREVTLRGTLDSAESVRLTFPQRPARVTVDAPQWSVAGVDEGRLLADSVTLTRRAAPAAPDAAGQESAKPRSGDEFPPFVRVHRRITLGLDGWTLDTFVERLAPAQGAFTLELPLLPGESVLSAGLPVREGRITVSMPADVGDLRWESTLATAPRLELQAPERAPWVEVWQVEPAALWRVAFAGTPEVFPSPDGGEPALHLFQPRPGEKLSLSITRPEAIAGDSVAFEHVTQDIDVGHRSTDMSLSIRYRSTQGGRHEVQLPEGARLQSVAMDGQPLALHAEQGKLVLPLQPGVHQVVIALQSDIGAALVTRPQPVSLGAPASNVATLITVPETRWILFTGGGGVGPAVLYWAELVVFVVLAVLLGRIAASPLSTGEWLLVGLGLSTFSWSVLLLFALWAFAMQWRRRWNGNVEPWIFNAVQVGLAFLTVVALGSLVSAIPNGLLGTPDMRIDGAGSVGQQLMWFHDRSADLLPQPAVTTVSIWFYKAAMLAWALWLSFALVRWVRGAWEAYSSGRLWFSSSPPGGAGPSGDVKAPRQ